MNNLILNVKKQLFDMILSGEKTEVYRELSDYWIKRLTNYDAYCQFRNIEYYKKFDFVDLKNGYSKKAPSFIIEFKGINITKTTHPKFVIQLGKIILTKNLKIKSIAIAITCYKP